MGSKRVNLSPAPAEGGGSSAVMDKPISAETELLRHLLEMADKYRAAGDEHAAEEIYFELVEKHEETTEAEQAERRLIEIAKRYETGGQRHCARAIYERLVRDEDKGKY
jgi:hypothetical protein